MDFDPQSESELASLDDDAIIDHISAARDAGDQDQMRAALGIFVFRRYDQVVNRIRIKVDADEDVEDLAMRVMTDVMAARFDGRHVGEAVNLINTITKRRIADFYERRRAENHVPLPVAGDTDEYLGPELDSGEDFTGALALAEIVTEAIDDLSEAHALVVRLSLTGLDAKQVAAKVNEAIPDGKPMTDTNVHQISKRFRDRIGRVLEESER